MGESEGVRYERTDGVATLTIDRPEKRNAIGPQQMEQLRVRMEEAGRDPEVRVVVVTGSGDRAFCAGGDLTGMTGDGVLAMHEARGRLVELFRTMWRLGKPIVARVNGYALGGGFGLAMACDLVVAAQEAKFGTPEIDVGLFPMMIMPVVFRSVGHRQGLELILTGRKVDAAEALAMGLVNRVVPRNELDDAVEAYCRTLKGKSPAVLKIGKEAYYTMREMPVDQAFEYLKAMITLNTMLEDAAVGIQAFLTRTEPRWTGR